MRDNLFKDSRIVSFLEGVEKMLYVEEQSSPIKEELMDHITCLVEDYIEAGYHYDKAVKKALYAMGDPQEIGYSFADYDMMKKRRWLLIGLKVSSVVVLLGMFALLVITGLGSEASASSNDTEPLKSLLSFLPQVFNLMNILLFGAGGSMIMSHSVRLLELDTKPELILWSSKGRFPWEYVILVVFFLPIIILFFVLYFFEEGFSGMTIMALWPILAVSYSVWAYIYSEKFRIPKYIVVKDGFVIKGRFMSWVAISNYTWSHDYMSKDNKDYKLILESRLNPASDIAYKRTLKVNYKQQKYLEKILYERVRV